MNTSPSWIRRLLLVGATAVVLVLIASACSSGAARVETGATSSVAQPAPTNEPAASFAPTTLVPVDDPKDPVAAAPAIPFPECDDVPGNGPPEAAELERLQLLRDQITADGLFDQPFVVSAGGPQSSDGILSVGLSRRDPDTIAWLAERVEPADLCLELPPAGYYERPFEAAVWELAPVQPRRPGVDPQTFILLLVDSANGGCGYDPAGRILEPIIVYAEETIEITIPLDHVPWGPATCQGWSPVSFELELTEDIAGRELVRGAEPS